MNNSLEDVVNRYYELAVKSESKDKIERPILVIRTVDGEKQVHLIPNRSELSLFTRLQAYFGFGSASLRNVAAVLREKKWNHYSAELNRSLNYIDSKISNHNRTSLIQKIGQILPLKSVAISHYNYGVSTTYHPKGSTPERDKEGILDFVHVFWEVGAAYVADGTGHGKADRHTKLKDEVWDPFNKDFVSDYELKHMTTVEELKTFLRDNLYILNGWVERKAVTASTFSFAMIVELEGKKHVVSIHVGDSALIHVSQKGGVKYLTPKSGPSKGLELSGLIHNSDIFIGVSPVQAGDKIFGVTDGVTDFLPEHTLNSILIKYQPSKEVILIDQLQDAIEKLPSFDSKDKQKSDDIGAFVLVVP